MRSKREQIHDAYSKCRSNAEKALPVECRALWLEVSASYEILLEYEDKYPTEKLNGSAQAID